MAIATKIGHINNIIILSNSVYKLSDTFIQNNIIAKLISIKLHAISTKVLLYKFAKFKVKVQNILISLTIVILNIK